MELIRCDNCKCESVGEDPLLLKVEKGIYHMGETWPKHFCDDKCIAEYFTKRTEGADDEN